MNHRGTADGETRREFLARGARTADDIAQLPSFHPGLAKAIHKALR